MKKIFFITTLALLLISAVSNGQATFQPKTYQYCEVYVAKKYLSTDTKIFTISTIDYGEATVVGKELQGDKNRAFNSIAEVLNYMDSQDWEFITEIYADNVSNASNTSYTHLLVFKRKV